MANEEVESAIRVECENIAAMLVAKNRAYGNSALDPLRVFSRADTTEQIRVRIDDKLSRIQRGGASNISEDTVLDLIGYLVLLRVAQKPAIASRVWDSEKRVHAVDVATGDDLDLIGADLGVYRFLSRVVRESDGEYRERIIECISKGAK